MCVLVCVMCGVCMCVCGACVCGVCLCVEGLGTEAVGSRRGYTVYPQDERATLILGKQPLEDFKNIIL